MNIFFKKISIIIALTILGGVYNVAFPVKFGKYKDFYLVKTIELHYNPTILRVTSDQKFLVAEDLKYTFFLDIQKLEDLSKKRTFELPILLNCVDVHQSNDLLMSSSALSSNGKYLFSGGCKDINVCCLHKDSMSSYFTMDLKGHTDKLKFLMVSPNRKYLISMSLDKTIKIWDLRGDHQAPSFGKELKSIPYSVSFFNELRVSPDGRYLIVADSSCVRILDLQGCPESSSFCEEIKMFSENSITSLAVSEDGNYLFLGLPDNSIKIRSLCGNPLSANFCKEIGVLTGHKDPVRLMTASKRYLFSVDSNVINVWQLPQPSKPSSFIAKDKILPYKQPGFKFPKFNDIKICFSKKSFTQKTN